ncbi:response regulator [Larkinella arboricola]|nr:response regulator [Larkinella arboricola]
MAPITDGPIVYVDDDEDDHFFLKKAIAELGLPNELRTFRDGQPVLDYLLTTHEKPLIILCDINMHRMNGLELRRQIDANEYLKQKSIPFIFFTTGAGPEQVLEAYKGNIQGFHTKASTYLQLKQQIHLIISYWQACLHPNSFQ